MTATERLRELLDERGVEWSATTGPTGTVWTHWDAFNGHRVHAMDNDDGTLEIFNVWDVTPEQAIDATLGRGECHIVKTWTDSDYADRWRYSCSECGYPVEVGERDIATGNPVSHANYCWNCGAKVVTE